MRSVNTNDPHRDPKKTGPGRGNAPRNEVRDMEVGEVRAVPYADHSQLRSLIYFDQQTTSRRYLTWRVRHRDGEKRVVSDELYVRREDDAAPAPSLDPQPFAVASAPYHR